jgi:phenylalanyl-tRNA synthetase beta chain
MKVLLSWLREYAPLTADPQAIGDALGALGTPVESMDRLGEGLDGVIVARVVEVRQHPNADYVLLVDVDAGDGEALQIGCGARNMAAGDLVALATVGATLPNGMEIARRKLRGEWSNGMLCALDELGLGPRGDGILILGDELAPAGTPLRDALGIQSDVLYDLEVNPNRPDAMAVAGVARDLAAWFRVPFAVPVPVVPEDTSASASELASVDIVDGDLCGRFVARVLRGVTIGPSPRAIASRLTLLGMRPINNVVDVSNYVMLELGRPSHPYDLDLLPRGAIRVRRARDGETLVTLDGIERRFTTEDLLICDQSDTPIGIAGLMGGASTEIGEDTTDVLLEMAWFDPMAIARMARRLNLRSEASSRFEKGADPFDIDHAGLRFAELLGVGVNGGPRLLSGAIDARGELPDRTPIRVRTARVNSILGTDLARGDIAGYLEPIGFASTPAAGTDDLDVTIPSFRLDSSTEIDVIEEVGRHHGYERIAKTMPRAARRGGLSPRQQDRRAVRAAMVGLGLSEAMPTPFLAPGDLARVGLPDDGITLTNPLVAEESVLRTSLLPGLLKSLGYNASHRNAGVGLFEIGHVFRAKAEPGLPDEREVVGVAWGGRDASGAVEAWQALVDVLALPSPRLEAAPAPGLHPGRTAGAFVDGEAVGVVGEVDPDVAAAHGIDERVAWLEVDLGRLLDGPHGDRPYRKVAKYPSSDVDLAFEVDDATPAGAVLETLRDAGGDLLVDLQLFDVYRGSGIAGGARSLAFRLRFQAPDRTLTDGEIADARARAIAAVEGAHPAKLRG